MKRVAVIGANPAWQKTLFFPSFSCGGINRADRISFHASGKGINFARAARRSGILEPVILQFTGGINGELLEEALDVERLSYRSVAIAGNTRCCTTCLSQQNGSMTEIIEPAPPVSPEESDEFMELLSLELPQCDAVAICGTSPVFAAEKNFNLRCARLAEAAGKILLIDAWRDLDPLLTEKSSFLLKINAEELAMLTGKTGILPGLEELSRRASQITAAITDGPGTAYLLQTGHVFRYALPKLENVINPLGSGDTASAVLAGSFLSGMPLQRAFACALGAASANCLTERCADYDVQRAAELAAAITIREL